MAELFVSMIGLAARTVICSSIAPGSIVRLTSRLPPAEMPTFSWRVVLKPGSVAVIL